MIDFAHAPIEELAELWLSYDRVPETRKEVQDMLDKHETEGLEEILRKPIEFGTAGLRSHMGAGFSRINCVTIIQASQGLSAYVKKTVPDALNRGIVIGHDHRHHSETFARLTAATFLTAGYKVYYYPNVCHTPSTPFAVKYLKAACGVMVTSSHNPKNDNGYKVYWENGAQIIPPHDSGIAKSIKEHFEPKVWDTKLVEHDPKVVDITDSMWKAYFEEASKLLETPKLNEATPLKYVYTAMHGVGAPYAKRMLEEMHLPPYIPVKEQINPDPDFPTVPFPNPEEKGTLDLGKKTADENGATLVVANDPDADRFTCAEKQPDGSWHRFTGDQLGTMFGAGVLARALRDGLNPETLAMVNSTVSSRMLEKICKKNHVQYAETLTGFKWMANRLLDFQKEGYKIMFAYEEAIGFMIHDMVLDKDGVTACGFFLQMAAQKQKEGKSMYDYMQDLYKEYGLHMSNNAYFICNEPEKTDRIFNRMRFGPKVDDKTHDVERFEITRADGKVLRYPTKLGVEPITGVRDLTFGFENHDLNGDNNRTFSIKSGECVPTFPCSSSQMITFYMPDGRLTLRTSGTEPKIKYYIEMHGDYDHPENVKKILDSVSESMSHDLMQSKLNEL